jgi:hypothetical protein
VWICSEMEIMIEQQFYDCEIGFLLPLCFEETRRYASDIVWFP